MDPTVLMHLEEKVKPWPNMMDSDVASAIFSDADYGFTPVVDSTEWSRQEDDHTLIQRGTDIQFLQQLAERNGFECFVELNDGGQVEGHFHPPKPDGQPQGTLTVNMGSATNVNTFQAKFDMLGPAVAQAATLDPDDVELPDGRCRRSGAVEQHGRRVGDARRPATQGAAEPAWHGAVGRGAALRAVGRRPLQLVDRRRGRAEHRRLRRVLRAKKPVMVRGVGQQFSGRYYVERVLHTIDGDGDLDPAVHVAPQRHRPDQAGELQE